MAKLGERRTLENVRDVAGERKEPRPIRQLVLAYHEDEDGNPTDQPMIVRSFRVVIGSKTMTVYNRACEHTRIPAEHGQLDFSRPVHESEITVRDAEFDPDGNCLLIINVSHEIQYRSGRGSTFIGENARTTYTTKQADSPNSIMPRINMLKSGKGNGILAGAVVQWQQQADSEDAIWIDGKAPTVEEENVRQEKLAKQRAEWATQRAYGRQAAPVGGPTGPTEVGGEDFGDV